MRTILRIIVWLAAVAYAVLVDQLVGPYLYQGYHFLVPNGSSLDWHMGFWFAVFAGLFTKWADHFLFNTSLTWTRS